MPHQKCDVIFLADLYWLRSANLSYLFNLQHRYTHPKYMMYKWRSKYHKIEPETHEEFLTEPNKLTRQFDKLVDVMGTCNRCSVHDILSTILIKRWPVDV